MTSRTFAVPAQTTAAFSRDGEPGSPSTCVTVHAGADRDVVALSGELDLHTAPQLRPVIRGLLARGQNRITVNLDDVTFIDCFTVSVLVGAHRDVARTGGSLDITHNPLCERLLTLTGTTTFPRR